MHDAIPENRRFRRARVLVASLAIAAAVAIGGCGSDDSSDVDAGGRSGGSGRAAATVAAPDFSLESLDGTPIRLSDYRGKVVLLDFWATWCAPCRMSVPHLRDLHDEFAASGLEIIGVAVGDREPLVRRFIEQFQIPYRVCLGDPRVTADYGISSIPTVYLIDRAGNVAGRFMGYQDKSVLENAIRGTL